MKRTIAKRLAACVLTALLLITAITMCSDNKNRATLVVNGETVKKAEAYLQKSYKD